MVIYMTNTEFTKAQAHEAARTCKALSEKLTLEEVEVKTGAKFTQSQKHAMVASWRSEEGRKEFATWVFGSWTAEALAATLA